jgi:starch-binding outer membrane protein, SusD/RagB family
MKKFKIIIITFFSALLLTPIGCIKEYNDPSNVVTEQVASNIDALIGVCNGLQLRYTVGRQSPLYQTFSSNGLVTFELRNINVGNTDELKLSEGLSSVVGANNAITQLWTQSFIMLKEANIIIDNVGKIPSDATTKAVVQSYAHVFKALAIGNLANFFEKMPITIGANQAFVTREEALKTAVKLLEDAESVYNPISTTIPTSLSSRLTISTGFELKNTIVALQARYNLMLKDYSKARTAADKVVLAVKSAFRFDAVNVNPIFFTAYSNKNVVEYTNKNFGLPASLAIDTSDKRLALYLNPAVSGSINAGAGFFKSNTADIPVYLPGEISLIKAECLAQTDVPAAVVELSNLIKKKPAADAWGVGADLAAGYTGAATKDAVLAEIYRQRCIELSNSGLRLEDSRRLGRPGPDAAATSRERNRNFFPYPQTERDNNTSTPTDPAL